jgi:thiol-disulfide isomerase/thioredoxin
MKYTSGNMNQNLSKLLLISLITITFSIQKSLAQNAPAPDYLKNSTFPDSVKSLSLTKLDGSQTNLGNVLKDLKGKKVVIDFWASWCKDCIVGLPKLQQLQTLASDPNTVYLFLSLDKEDAKWKLTIDKHQIIGEHYKIDQGWKNPLSNYIGLDWIPRYMILDQNAKVILPKAVNADDKIFEKVVQY